jgi:hypothetical protein
MRDDLGYDYIYGPNVLRDYRSPLHEELLLSSLGDINPTLSADAINEAVYKLKNFESINLLQKNCVFMDYLQNGVEVSTLEKGEMKYDRVKLIDFDQPDRHTFYVINQWTIVENAEKRPDVVIFINGLPLVVMELKVSEDPDMPLQSLDYWGRVSVHNSNGDFERRGYFAGIRLSRARPKLYLVAPIFTFHDSLESLLRCLDAHVEVTKIAINEDWRCGVKILRRSAFRCGDFQ